MHVHGVQWTSLENGAMASVHRLHLTYTATGSDHVVGKVRTEEHDHGWLAVPVAVVPRDWAVSFSWRVVLLLAMHVHGALVALSVHCIMMLCASGL